MFSLPVRLFLVVGNATLGAYFLSRGDRAIGWLLLFGAAAGIWGYFRHGAIRVAFQAYCKADVRRMRRHLRTTIAATLSRQYRAYYDWLSSVLSIEEGNFTEARERLRAALEGPLRTESARATVLCLLAQTEIELGNVERAESHLREARRLRPRDDVAAVISQLEKRCLEAVP